MNRFYFLIILIYCVDLFDITYKRVRMHGVKRGLVARGIQGTESRSLHRSLYSYALFLAKLSAQ